MNHHEESRASKTYSEQLNSFLFNVCNVWKLYSEEAIKVRFKCVDTVVQLDDILANVAELSALYFFSYKRSTHEQKQNFQIS